MIPKWSYQEQKLLVNKYVKPEYLKGNIKRETIFARRLLDLIPDLNFWHWYNPGFQAKSLAFFTGMKFRPELRKAYKLWSVKPEKIEVYDYEEKNVKEFDVPKQKTLFDFV